MFESLFTNAQELSNRNCIQVMKYIYGRRIPELIFDNEERDKLKFPLCCRNFVQLFRELTQDISCSSGN